MLLSGQGRHADWTTHSPGPEFLGPGSFFGVNRYAQRDEVLRQMGYSSYREYLASPLWKKIKARLFKVCDRCPCGAPATEAHHRTYKRRYLEGRGKLHKFVVPVCRSCHQSIEFDGTGKTPLGLANRRLDEIRLAAESKGIHMPYKARVKPR